MLYQCVCMCVFGGGGPRERISKAFLISGRRQPGILSLSRGAGGEMLYLYLQWLHHFHIGPIRLHNGYHIYHHVLLLLISVN